MIWQKKTVADATPQLPLAELRKRARILVIDDDPHAFPHELLQKEGYNIAYWETVRNLHDLENGEFDIIVLDINDIASPEISDSGGIGVLAHIKKYNPAQIVIAYSGQKYDLSHSDFWKMADDYLGKPSSLLACKQKIDNLLQQRFTAAYYAEIMRNLLLEQGVAQKKITKLEHIVVKHKDKTSGIPVETISKCVGISKDAASTISVIITVILRLLHHPIL